MKENQKSRRVSNFSKPRKVSAQVRDEDLGDIGDIEASASENSYSANIKSRISRRREPRRESPSKKRREKRREPSKRSSRGDKIKRGGLHSKEIRVKREKSRDVSKRISSYSQDRSRKERRSDKDMTSTSRHNGGLRGTDLQRQTQQVCPRARNGRETTSGSAVSSKTASSSSKIVLPARSNSKPRNRNRMDHSKRSSSASDGCSSPSFSSSSSNSTKRPVKSCSNKNSRKNSTRVREKNIVPMVPPVCKGETRETQKQKQTLPVVPGSSTKTEANPTTALSVVSGSSAPHTILKNVNNVSVCVSKPQKVKPALQVVNPSQNINIPSQTTFTIPLKNQNPTRINRSSSATIPVVPVPKSTCDMSAEAICRISQVLPGTGRAVPTFGEGQSRVHFSNVLPAQKAVNTRFTRRIAANSISATSAANRVANRAANSVGLLNRNSISNKLVGANTANRVVTNNAVVQMRRSNVQMLAAQQVQQLGQQVVQNVNVQNKPVTFASALASASQVMPQLPHIPKKHHFSNFEDCSSDEESQSQCDEDKEKPTPVTTTTSTKSAIAAISQVLPQLTALSASSSAANNTSLSNGSASCTAKGNDPSSSSSSSENKNPNISASATIAPEKSVVSTSAQVSSIGSQISRERSQSSASEASSSCISDSESREDVHSEVVEVEEESHSESGEPEESDGSDESDLNGSFLSNSHESELDEEELDRGDEDGQKGKDLSLTRRKALLNAHSRNFGDQKQDFRGGRGSGSASGSGSGSGIKRIKPSRRRNLEKVTRNAGR